MELADKLSSLTEPDQSLEQLGFAPTVTKNPYIMRRLREHLDDLLVFDQHMEGAFGAKK